MICLFYVFDFCAGFWTIILQCFCRYNTVQLHDKQSIPVTDLWITDSKKTPTVGALQCYGEFVDRQILVDVNILSDVGLFHYIIKMSFSYVGYYSTVNMHEYIEIWFIIQLEWFFNLFSLLPYYKCFNYPIHIQKDPNVKTVYFHWI